VLVVAATIVAICLGLFVLIAEDLLDGGGLISHDQAVLAWFVEHRTDFLISIARLLSALGSFVGLAILALLIALVIRAWGWRWRLALAPLVALLVASLTSTCAKALFGRERPPVTFHATTVTLAAFPSGHATDAAACFLAAASVLALTLARRRYAQIGLVLTGLVLTGLVGVSRLVLGVRWLSDVIAGWALGTIVATLAAVVAWLLNTRPSGPGEPEALVDEHGSPGGD
jgi:undecaprenyl-diphosphatase